MLGSYFKPIKFRVSNPSTLNILEDRVFGVCGCVGEGGGGGGRDNRSWALRLTRPHTVGYKGVCDQEQGVVEWCKLKTEDIYDSECLTGPSFEICTRQKVLIWDLVPMKMVELPLLPHSLALSLSLSLYLSLSLSLSLSLALSLSISLAHPHTSSHTRSRTLLA